MSTSLLSLFADAIDHGDGVRVAALLEDRQVDGALAIDADDVVLKGLRVLGFPDVGDAHGRLPHHLERRAIDVVGTPPSMLLV